MFPAPPILNSGFHLILVSTSVAFEVLCADVIQAVRSFPCCLAGGLDKLCPQQLKDLLQLVGAENLECQLMIALADFCFRVFHGVVPGIVIPLFFEPSLVALKTRTGGVRPFAVGCTLRWLAAKTAGRKVLDEMKDLLSPRQLGYGIRGGAEAAIHTTRRFLFGNQKDAIVKLAFVNAFNSVQRDCVLSTVQSLCPILYPFV